MAKYRYDILPLEIADNPKAKVLSVADAELINSYEIKNVFNTTQANVRLDITNLEGDLITSEEYFKDYSLLGNAQSAGESGASTLTIDIERDIIIKKPTRLSGFCGTSRDRTRDTWIFSPLLYHLS